jgi:repressor LexA
MKNNEISERQKQILDFISKKKKEEGFCPTIREIASAVNLKSSATVYNHLSKLEELGLIKREGHKSRYIELLEDDYGRSQEEVDIDKKNTVFVPIVGNIAAGKPILAEQNIEDYVPLSDDFAKGNNEIFVLKVKGDSMVNAGILDRDYAIIKRQDTAINGEIIAALVDDEEATIKRFIKGDNIITLLPENNNMKPIKTNNVKVIGKVVGILRKYF